MDEWLEENPVGYTYAGPVYDLITSKVKEYVIYIEGRFVCITL